MLHETYAILAETLSDPTPCLPPGFSGPVSTALGWVLAPTAAMSCKKPASRSSAKRWGRFFMCWNNASFCRSPSSPDLTVSSWELLYPLPSARQQAAEVV